MLMKRSCLTPLSIPFRNSSRFSVSAISVRCISHMSSVIGRVPSGSHLRNKRGLTEIFSSGSMGAGHAKER
jgi:hypothetical protein